MDRADAIATAVRSDIESAMLAVRARDIEAVVRCLSDAVTLYEAYPTQAQAPTSQLRDLLVFIRSARSLCKTLKRNDDDLRGLEDRAEALRESLH